MAIATLTPLTLDELDQVAGGLSDPDKTQPVPDGTTQGADGAAFAQTQAETPQDRFAGLMQDFGDNRTLDQSTPQEIAALSSDIADGRLDAQLGTLVDTVGQLDATKDAPELAKLAGALLDRFADFGNSDRPAALAGLLDKPAFQPDKLVALSDSLLDSEPRAGIALLVDATQAYDDAGRTTPADSLRDALADQLGEVLTDAAGDGDAALASTIAWTSEALEGTKGAAWTMVDALLDAPANDRTEAALSQSLSAALKSDLDPQVAGRLLADGVVTPNALAVGLLQNYDPVTDNPAAFEAELKAIAAEAGTARAGFEAIVRATTFEALVRESVDGTLDAAELKQAAGLLLADRSLPADALDDRTLLPVFKEIGTTLANTVNSLTFPPTMKMGQVDALRVTQFNALAAQLHDLGDAGPAAIAQALVTMVQTANNGRSIDLLSLVRAVSDSPLATLVVAVGLATQLPSNTYNRVGQLSVIMATALNGDGAVDTLSQAVLKGEIDGIAAEKLIADLAARSGITTPGLVAWRQAELAAAVAEGGNLTSQIVLDLKADLAAKPSPLIAAAAQHWASAGANETLQDLIVMAEAVDADVNALLVRVFTEGKVTANVEQMLALVPRAIAGLIAEGQFSADEARSLVRSACTALSVGTGATNAGWISYVAELSEARLVSAAASQTTSDPDAGSELRELRDEYCAAVAGGFRAMDVVRAMQGSAYNATQIIELINAIGAASSTFSGSLMVDVLTQLGPGSDPGGKNASNSWQFRDELRAELNRVLTGDAATQASWVSALQQAVSGGQQSAAEIVDQLELIVENAFARERLSATGDHYNMNDAARLSIRNVWDGLDRLVAATGVALLANAGTSAAARGAALDWFREQTPGGQAAILSALPANHAERATLNAMAAAQLDNFDWAAERRNVEQTISIGNYAENSSKWAMFKAEQARDDLRGAVQLARLVGESALDPILDMARAWQVMPTDTITPALSHVRNAVALVAFETLTAARDNAAFGDALAQEVKTREETSVQVRADIEAVRTLALTARDGLLDSQRSSIGSQFYLSATAWAVLIENVSSGFTAGLVRAGMPNEAAALFVAGIDSGAGLASLNGITSRNQAQLALQALVNEAGRLGASVDHVLVSALDPANHVPPDCMDAARAMLQARFADSKVVSDLVTEVRQGDMSAAAAFEVLREAAAYTNRSFGSLLAGMLDSVETTDTKTYGILANALQVYGGGNLAMALGGDVLAGRIDAAGAIAATLEIGQATKFNVDLLSALVVGAGKTAIATDLAARAIAEMPKFADMKTEAGQTAISHALDQIRNTLAINNLPLATANIAALTALAGLYVAGGVNAGDIGQLIDQFDGKIPDAGLVSLLDTINGLPDSPRQDALEYLVSDRLADRVESGALFTDAIAAIQATVRSGIGIENAAATAVLQMIEKAVAGAAYSGYVDEAVKHGATAAVAAARADALVAESVLLHQATGAYQLFKAADAVNNGAAPAYVLWLINANDQTNRDLVMGGMWMEMATKIGPDGTVPADVQARYTAMQNELMEPELTALAGGLRAALANPAAFEAAKMAAAASIAADIGRITSRFASEVHDVSNSSAAAAVTTGDSSADLRDEIIAHGTQWAVVLGSAYRNYLASGPSGIAMSVAFGVTAQLLKIEAFRDFIGEGIAMPLDLGLKAMAMARAVVVEGMTVWTNGQIDAAMGAWEGTNDFFSGIADGDVAAAGEALLKLADDINTLLNFTDFRGQFEVMKAMINKAVEQITIAFSALAEAIDGLYEADKQYDRTHKLGMSFL